MGSGKKLKKNDNIDESLISDVNNNKSSMSFLAKVHPANESQAVTNEDQLHEISKEVHA